VAQYITLEELADLGLSPKVFINLDRTKRLQAIQSMSDLIDGYLGRFTLPLVSWGNDIKQCCATLASIQLIKNLGTNPDAADRYDHDEAKWLAWLKMVSLGTAIPRVVDGSSGSSTGVTAPRPMVISASQRGLSVRGTMRQRGPFQGN
jgi:phage gp36-like protein